MELCSVYDKCGGCNKLDIAYEYQLKEKEEHSLQIFKDKEIEIENFKGIKPSPELYHYRNKMEYTFGDEYKGGPLNLGMKGRKMKFNVYYTRDCKIADKDFNDILIYTREYFKELGFSHRNYRSHTGYLRHLSLRSGKNTGQLMVHLSTDLTDENDKAVETWAEGLQKLKLDGKIVSIIHSKTDRKANVLQVDEMRVLYGNDYYMDKIDDLEFKIGPMSFFQTNTKGAEVLYNTALEYAENAEKVFDLYSGTGTIASLLSKKAKNIYAVELVEEAVQAAKENAEKNGINNVEFHAGDVKEIVEKLPEPDYVVVDPPRAGLHKNVVKYLNNKKFDKIIYVSCNPTTLAENLRDMKKVYKVKELTFMDMFPHTRHLESVALLEKR